MARYSEIEAADSSAEQICTTPRQVSDWESHFWASTFPFFKTSLFISPRSSSPEGDEHETSEAKEHSSASVSSVLVESAVQIFDADGELINDISVQSRADDVTVLELDQFMGAAKLEGGQKHVHLRVVSSAPAFHMCRLHTAKGSAVLGEPIPLSAEHSVFFPLRVGEDRQNQLCVVSAQEEVSSVKCRLFMGARTPEFYFSVPGNGSRIFSVEAEFADHLEGMQGDRQCYLRLSTKSKGSLGVQLVERVGSDREIGMYASVS